MRRKASGRRRKGLLHSSAVRHKACYFTGSLTLTLNQADVSMKKILQLSSRKSKLGSTAPRPKVIGQVQSHLQKQQANARRNKQVSSREDSILNRETDFIKYLSLLLLKFKNHLFNIKNKSITLI